MLLSRPMRTVVSTPVERGPVVEGGVEGGSVGGHGLDRRCAGELGHRLGDVLVVGVDVYVAATNARRCHRFFTESMGMLTQTYARASVLAVFACTACHNLDFSAVRFMKSP